MRYGKSEEKTHPHKPRVGHPRRKKHREEKAGSSLRDPAHVLDYVEGGRAQEKAGSLHSE